MICAALEAEGAAAAGAETLGAALALAGRERPDLIILDFHLPDGHGLDLCRRLRGGRGTKGTLCGMASTGSGGALRDVPIIALTAHGDLAGKRAGFEAGLDQFLTKPIELEELALWARALLRRAELRDRRVPPAFRKDDVEIDREAHLVVFGGRRITDLTRREFQLFHALAAEAPRLFSRADILAKVWGTVAVENLVDAHIHNLRKKLPPALAARLVSVPGKGFRYSAPPGRGGGS